MSKKKIIFIIIIAVISIVFITAMVFNMQKKPVQKDTGKVQAPPSDALENPDPLKAIEHMKGLLEKNPNDADAWVYLGDAYIQVEDLKNALEAYKKAVELRPDDASIMADLGAVLRESGDVDGAIKELERAIKIDSKSEKAYFFLGVIYRFDKKDFKKAREVWGKYLEISPNGIKSDQIRLEMEKMKKEAAG